MTSTAATNTPPAPSVSTSAVENATLAPAPTSATATISFAASPIAGAATSAPLTVQIFSPVDESVVNVSQVEVKGQSLPHAVITLNDKIVIADAAGAFSATVPLVEGPNIIEVVASDEFGNEVSLQLTVTYDPES